MIGLGQIGRYVRVAGLGLESGRAASQAMAMKNAGAIAARSNIPAIKNTAPGMLQQGDILQNNAAKTLAKSERYGKWTALDPSYSSKVADTFRNIGQVAEPVLTPAIGVAKTAGRLAGGAMNNPIGMTAIGFAPFMFMGGTGTLPLEEGMVDPMTGAMLPPSPLPQGMPQEFAPMPTALNDEQIARAKKRAEEQAALNQFYAQSLQQYRGQ